MKNNWPTKKLGEVCQLQMGETLIKKDLTNEGIPVYSADSLDVPWGFTSNNRLVFNKGSIIIGARGTIGSVKLPMDEEFTATQTTIVLTPNTKEVNSDFLHYFLKKINLKNIRGGTGIPMLTIGHLLTVEIPLPPLPTQQKIVKILDSIQEAVGVQERIIEKTKELKKAMMKKLFTEGKRGEKLKETEIGKMPESWEVKKIKQIGEVVTGTTPSTTVNEYWNGDIPFITPVDFSENNHIFNTERTVSSRGAEKGRLIPKNSIVVVCIGSTIGKIALTGTECITNQQINTVICYKENNPVFVYYAILLRKESLRSYAATTAKPIIKKSLFETFQIPIPHRSEQREIASILQTIDQKIEIEQKKKALYEELFKTLLNKIMNQVIDAEKIKV